MTQSSVLIHHIANKMALRVRTLLDKAGIDTTLFSSLGVQQHIFVIQCRCYYTSYSLHSEADWSSDIKSRGFQ